MPDEPLPTRYQSSEGWEPPDPYKKLRDAHRKTHSVPAPNETMLELRRAGEWITRGGTHRVQSPELFGPLWREGEVAILFGDTGTGKSLLAVQIAESIATGAQGSPLATPQSGAISSPPYKGGVAAFRGRGGSSVSVPPAVAGGVFGTSPVSVPPAVAGGVFGTEIQNPKSKIQNRRTVLYLDFELTARQFAERYSVPSPIAGKLPIRHRFSRKFIRSEVKWDGHIPDAFKGDLTKFLRHSVAEAIESSGARIVIIDNISYLTGHTTRDAKPAQIMQMLKLWSAASNLSILVLAGQNHLRKRAGSLSSPPYEGGVAALRGRGGSLRPITIADLPNRSMADLADSVFAIAHSTYGPDFRYIKHLKSRTAPDVRTGSSSDRILSPDTDVLTYQLGRIPAANPHSASSPPAGGGVDAALGGRGGGSPHSEGPFLGFTFLGPSQESGHLRNYAAEAREVSNPHSAIRNPQSKKGVVDMLLSREYWRYLER